MTLVIIRRIVTASLVLWAAYAFARQCRRPAGWLGRRVARAMNLGHARLTAWGLSHVTIGTDGRILDVGCGGGQTIRTLDAIYLTLDEHREALTAAGFTDVDVDADRSRG